MDFANINAVANLIVYVSLAISCFVFLFRVVGTSRDVYPLMMRRTLIALLLFWFGFSLLFAIGYAMILSDPQSSGAVGQTIFRPFTAWQDLTALILVRVIEVVYSDNNRLHRKNEEAKEKLGIFASETTEEITNLGSLIERKNKLIEDLRHQLLEIEEGMTGDSNE